MKHAPIALAFVAILALAVPGTAAAQQGWPPDSTENLQVLPEDMPIRELVRTMRGIAGALGVRCIHCHVGDDPSNLSAVDFVSDERVEKEKAREMLRMVDRINSELLADVPDRSEPPVEVTCRTCHRGVTVPRDIRDILADRMSEGGADSVIAEYERLREEYYGTGSYNFYEFTLTGLGERTMREYPEETLVVLDHNLTHFPNSSLTYTMKAQVQANVMRDFEGAIASLEEAKKLDPDEVRYDAMIEQLRGALEEAPQP